MLFAKLLCATELNLHIQMANLTHQIFCRQPGRKSRNSISFTSFQFVVSYLILQANISNLMLNKNQMFMLLTYEEKTGLLNMQ